MKKFLFSLVLFLLCLQYAGFSQKSRVGISAGAAFARMHSSEEEVNDLQSSSTGYTAGIFVETPLANNFSFQPGLHYVQKGTKTEEDGDGITIALRYAEMTFNFLYNTNGERGGFFFGLGPTFSAHLPSKIITESGGAETTSDLKFGNTDADDIRGFDYGANIIAGVKTTGGFVLSVNYTRGFRNLIPGDDEGQKLSNTVFAVKIGLLFKNGK